MTEFKAYKNGKEVKFPTEDVNYEVRTTKEIIVDNVDIYECTYSAKGIDGCWYCEEDLYDDGSPVYKCKENHTCYYKQLKRLEFELKVTKADYDASESELLELKLENKELKKENQNFKSLKIEMPYDIEIQQLERENERLKEEVRLLHKGYKPVELYSLFGKPIRYWENLEQENAELKTVHKQLKQMIKSKESLLEKAIKENEELKHRCEVYHQCDEMIKNTYGQAHKEGVRLAQENNKYKSTLEEIREIVNFHRTDADSFDVQNDMNDIFTKINEVLK